MQYHSYREASRFPRTSVAEDERAETEEAGFPRVGGLHRWLLLSLHWGGCRTNGLFSVRLSERTGAGGPTLDELGKPANARQIVSPTA